MYLKEMRSGVLRTYNHTLPPHIFDNERQHTGSLFERETNNIRTRTASVMHEKYQEKKKW